MILVMNCLCHVLHTFQVSRYSSSDGDNHHYASPASPAADVVKPSLTGHLKCHDEDLENDACDRLDDNHHYTSLASAGEMMLITTIMSKLLVKQG